MKSASPTQEGHEIAGPARGAAAVFRFAAAPSFALMAWVSARHASSVPLCGPSAGGLPVDPMTTMYLLMSLFHLPPWLTLASRRTRPASLALTQGD